jgi:hypothetical protein
MPRISYYRGGKPVHPAITDALKRREDWMKSFWAAIGPIHPDMSDSLRTDASYFYTTGLTPDEAAQRYHEYRKECHEAAQSYLRGAA